MLSNIIVVLIYCLASVLMYYTLVLLSTHFCTLFALSSMQTSHRRANATLRPTTTPLENKYYIHFDRLWEYFPLLNTSDTF